VFDNATDRSMEKLSDQYECDRTLDTIERNGYCRVALQFPDEMLRDAPRVCQFLMAQSKIRQKREKERQHDVSEHTEPLFFVIGDTSYGNCCVDEVAAQHLDADLVVHYGHACLSPTSRLPVLYVFGRKPLTQTLQAIATCLSTTLLARSKEKRAFLFYELAYEAIIPDVALEMNKQLVGSHVDVTAARLPLASVSPIMPFSEEGQYLASQATGCEKEAGKVIFAGGLELRVENNGEEGEGEGGDAVVIYIGESENNKQLINIMLRFNACDCLVYDPASPPLPAPPRLREVSVKTSQALKRRYYLVQRARDASVFGVVVGTLGVGRYMSVVAAVRRLIARAGKKAYTLLIGKLNAAKLANFAEIETFVLVACPEASLLEDGGRAFHAPVVTPLEMEMALGGKSWDGSYSTDFRELESLCQSCAQKERGLDTDLRKNGNCANCESDGEDEPYFSLVSGGYKGGVEGKAKGTLSLEGSTALTKFSSPAGDFLQLREYRGLGHDKHKNAVCETETGDRAEDGEGGAKPPAGIVEGRRGVASDYDNV